MKLQTPTLADTGQKILIDAALDTSEPRADILLSAAGCILADRAAAYGPPEDNFANIVALWNAYLEMRKQRNPADPSFSGDLLDGADQAVMMALMKIARLATNPTHKDSWVDAAGYLACGWRCVQADKVFPMPVGSDIETIMKGIHPADTPFMAFTEAEPYTAAVLAEEEAAFLRSRPVELDPCTAGTCESCCPDEEDEQEEYPRDCPCCSTEPHWSKGDAEDEEQDSGRSAVDRYLLERFANAVVSANRLGAENMPHRMARYPFVVSAAEALNNADKLIHRVFVEGVSLGKPVPKGTYGAPRDILVQAGYAEEVVRGRDPEPWSAGERTVVLTETPSKPVFVYGAPLDGDCPSSGVCDEYRWDIHLRDLKTFGENGAERDWWTTPWGNYENRGEVPYPVACRLMRDQAHEQGRPW